MYGRDTTHKSSRATPYHWQQWNAFLPNGDLMRPYYTACLATKLTSWLSLNRQVRLNDNIRLIISSYRGGRPLNKGIKVRCVISCFRHRSVTDDRCSPVAEMKSLTAHCCYHYRQLPQHHQPTSDHCNSASQCSARSCQMASQVHRYWTAHQQPLKAAGTHLWNAYISQITHEILSEITR